MRTVLLAECLEAYAELNEDQNERVQALLHTETYREVELLMKTTYERGVEDGIALVKAAIERGMELGERRATLRVLEAKFGPQPPEVKGQLETMSLEAVIQFQFALHKAESLEELRLDG